MNYILSDNELSFNANRSLLEKPTEFSSSWFHGCVFYLPVDGEKGGDFFMIQERNKLAIALLTDMTGHGDDGRTALRDHIPALVDLVDNASRVAEEGELIEKISILDNRTNPPDLMALSIVQVYLDGCVSYMNEGENHIVFIKHGKAYDNSSKISHGKIGFLKYVPIGLNDPLGFRRTRLGSKGRICLYTDGVTEYLGRESTERKTREYVHHSLKNVPDIVDCVVQINRQAAKNLEKKGLSKPLDDYTIIAFEKD